MIQMTCEVCSGSFFVKPYRAKSARFCSHKCGGIWHMRTRTMPNAHKAGNKWRAGLRPTNAFTSEQARAINLVAGEEHICANCGTGFSIKPWIARQNPSKSGKRFCSKACHAQFKAREQSGPNAPDWVGGPATYRGRGWRVARALAVERDNGTCQHCGKLVGKSIPVHHKRPFRLFSTPAEANHIDNLICLCQPCHMKAEPRT
jgi:hypothetical protein